MGEEAAHHFVEFAAPWQDLTGNAQVRCQLLSQVRVKKSGSSRIGDGQQIRPDDGNNFRLLNELEQDVPEYVGLCDGSISLPALNHGHEAKLRMRAYEIEGVYDISRRYANTAQTDKMDIERPTGLRFRDG